MGRLGRRSCTQRWHRWRKKQTEAKSEKDPIGFAASVSRHRMGGMRRGPPGASRRGGEVSIRVENGPETLGAIALSCDALLFAVPEYGGGHCGSQKK